MSLESKNLRCPYCGGEIHRSINQGGIENHVCKSCRHEFFVEQGYSLETLFCLNSFRNEVINLLYAKIAGGKKQRIQSWQNNKERFEKYIQQCGGEFNQDPLFAITRAAYITDGFEHYPSPAAKEIAESLYSTANEYIRKNKKSNQN